MAEAVRDYGKLALDIIRLVGGKSNITSAARCATRLRLVLEKVPEGAEEEIKGLPGVITVVQKQGQFQIVIGNHVGDVFEVVAKELNLEQKTENAEAPKETLLNRLLQMMSGVFAPICYILAAGGLLQGVLILLTMAVPSVAETGAYQILNMISWTPFTFLPVLIAVSASKHFRCNTFIAVACVLALVNPTFTEMVQKAAEGENIRIFFVNLAEITYTSSVLPPLILVALLAKLEKFLKKYLPETIKQLFTPLICMVVMIPLTIMVVGPVIQGISNGVAAGYNWLYAAAPVLAGAVVGGLWQVIVIFGIQWGMVPVVIANFAQNGQDTIQIFIEIAIMAQMAAAFGVYLKTKDKNLKANALSAGVTAIFGITEPTIYGITLPRKKPFIYASIWAAIGSTAAAAFGAVQYVYAGLPGLVSIVNSISAENPNSFRACLAGSAITIIGTVVTILIFGYEEKSKTGKQTAETANGTLEEVSDSGKPDRDGIIFSPLTGELKLLKDVNDPTFSEEILGKGFAVVPAEGKVYAPFDGTVSSLMDTKHAIGLTDRTGMEVLIHIGLETVSLGGKYFEVKVQPEMEVKKGDLLIEFDLDEIKKSFDPITPVIITNSDDFSDIKALKEPGSISVGEAILEVKKEDDRNE